MKRAFIFVWVALLLSATCYAQESTPAPSPIEPQRPPAGARMPNTPAQAVVPVPVPIAPPKPNGPVQKSLVRITNTAAEPDYKAPWNAGGLQRSVGAGFVIDGNRIMTNAHVVSNSRYLTVERDGDPNKYPAKVQFLANDCDLALITVPAPDFFKNMIPLKFGGIPALESTVSAYGYPIGGERMSVTTGIVSRVDFQLYTHSSIDQHLAIQISAQINPGNSGGPVMQDSKVVGVAFQGYSGDVLLAVDGHPIASDSNVELEGERAEFQEVVERKFRGDSVKFDIWRDKKPMTVTVKLFTPWPYLILGHSYDVHPRYVLYGGLLFQPLNLDSLETYRPTDLRLRHFFEYFVQEQIYLQHPDVIVLTNILPDPINTYLGPYRGGIVDEVNGKKIHTLDELASAFAEAPEHFVIRMIGDGPPLVLDRAKVEAARERIKARYNVLKEQNLEEQPISKTPQQVSKI